MQRRLKESVRAAARRTRVGVVVSLRAAARLYGDTDKVSHGYLTHYHRHFRSIRFKKLVVIEIGVGGYESSSPGGSLRVWRDYFPRSTIIGVDLYQKRIDLGRRVRFVRADQSSAEDLQRVLAAAGRAPDVIIDDGSHIGEHVRTTFDVLFQHLAPLGTYVIEDLHTSYWPDYGGSHTAPSRSAIGLVHDAIDAVQSRDAAFVRRPELGPAPRTSINEVTGVSIYPGIAFIRKADLS